MVVYIVVENCGGSVDATAYATREDAVRAIEHLSLQSRGDWAFADGTVYDGDSNYEATAFVVESKVYEGVEEYGK